jgi:hypothetical protein
MAAPKSRSAGDKTPGPRSRPPYYIAVQPLFIDGSQFARAHNPGDRVPADHVDAYGWADLVRPPDGYDAAERPADEPPSEPETTTGQATSSKEGDV